MSLLWAVKKQQSENVAISQENTEGQELLCHSQGGLNTGQVMAKPINLPVLMIMSSLMPYRF